jgi:hypothetical protein
MHAHARPDAVIACEPDAIPDVSIRACWIAGSLGGARSRVRTLEGDAEWSHVWTPWYRTVASHEIAVAGRPIATLPVTLAAGCAAGVAYMLKEEVAESGVGAPLITTGAIDRWRCSWGSRPTRFLGTDFAAPRWPDVPRAPAVARALARQQRPKLLIGGLTSVIEALPDLTGEFGGVVSTWALMPDVTGDVDDARARKAVMLLGAVCNSATFTRVYRARHGAKAMSGRQMTIARRDLSAMPFPHAIADWLCDDLNQPAASRLTALAEAAMTGDALADDAIHEAVGELYGRSATETREDIAYWREFATRRASRATSGTPTSRRRRRP